MGVATTLLCRQVKPTPGLQKLPEYIGDKSEVAPARLSLNEVLPEGVRAVVEAGRGQAFLALLPAHGGVQLVELLLARPMALNWALS